MNAITTILHSLADTKLGKFSIKHAPQISMVLGGVLGAGAIVTTVISTKRTIDLMDEEKVKRAEKANAEAKKSQGSNSTKQGEKVEVVFVKPEDIKLKAKDVVAIAWKSWIVPIGLAGGSLLSFIAAYKLEHNKTIVLATMLSGSEAKLISMEKEMVEKLGEKKAEEIQRAAKEKDISKEPEKEEKKEPEKETVLPTSENGLMIHVIEGATGQSVDTKFSNIKYALKDGSKAYDAWGEIDLNEWLSILESSIGKPLNRSIVGENLKLKKKANEDFENDVIRIAWTERDDHEPECTIEYREPWVYSK